MSNRKQIHVYLPLDLLDRLEARVPDRKRSEWIVQAVRERLDREAVQEQLDALAARVAELEGRGERSEETR